jgi:hypothetical protein
LNELQVGDFEEFKFEDLLFEDKKIYGGEKFSFWRKT